MAGQYKFGKLGNNQKFLYINNNELSIKSGKLALFGDKYLTIEDSIKISEISNIDIQRPTMSTGYMKISTSSGKEIKIDIATIKQYNIACNLKKELLNK